MSASLKFSVQAQAFAAALGETLEMMTGEPVAFVLVIQIDKVAQYVANCKREEGVELIESLLARWKANRADIPAHYNPDLPK
jgi:hypothetical protein